MTVHSMRSMEGQDVIALDTAEDIGEVKHFVVSQDGARIERLHIDGRKKNALFAEWGDLESFGDDKVIVKKAATADTSDTERDLDAVKGNFEILDARVLDTAGFEHGTVDDVNFESGTGAIVSITSSDGEVTPAEHIHSLGSYALIIDA